MVAASAFFTDGKTAARHEVTVAAMARGLEIRDGNGLLLAHWAYGDLYRLDSPDAALRLTARQDSDARLILPPSPLTGAIRVQAPHLFHRRHRWLWPFAAVAALTLAAGLYFALPALSRPIARLIPQSWQESWGQGIAASLSRHAGACDGAAGRAALERLSARLTEQLDNPRSFRLLVVDDKTVNAFATGGGTILLLRGLIDDARSPDEIAGVLAHEMGHDRLNHVAERIVRQMGIGLVATIMTGDASGMAAAAGASLLSLSYSRQDEAAADAFAVTLLDKAGIGTDGMADFFRRLAARDGDGLTFLNSHPASSDRAIRVGGHAGQAKAMNEQDWSAVKSMCRAKSP